MPSNQKTNTKKQSTPQQTATQQVAVPVVEQATAPVAAPVVEQATAATSAPSQTGGRRGKQANVQATAPVAAPVAEQATAPVATPVAAPSQTGGRRGKRAAQPAVVEPAVVEPAVVATPVVEQAAQTGGRRRGKQATKQAISQPAKAGRPTKKTEGKPARGAQKAPRKPRTPKVQQTETTEAIEADLDNGKRSFKAMLPGSETFEGRYTGLTPYQAANKALSKFYRESKNEANGEITFSIRESTRGSKRTVYTYNGHREKLGVPVEYTIKGKDGERTVVKEYKNRLTKVKKADADVQTVEA